MTEAVEFGGRILDSSLLTLGEGPTFDPATGTAWWFDIIGKTLHELHLSSGSKRQHTLPFLASVLAHIDGERQLVASEDGLFIRDIASGKLEPYVEFEPGKPGNRSNDGRVHPSGALWIGTMGKKAEDGAGAIYHIARGTVTRLFERISIPNAICFSPDGTTGYYTDTADNRLMRVALDPATGLPVGDATVLVDGNDRPGGFDGAVCDADGTIWNARWGAGQLDRYAADGRLISSFDIPASQVTCPAFIGDNARRILVTSAHEGMDDAARAEDKLAGATFEAGMDVNGVFDTPYKL